MKCEGPPRQCRSQSAATLKRTFWMTLSPSVSHACKSTHPLAKNPYVGANTVNSAALCAKPHRKRIASPLPTQQNEIGMRRSTRSESQPVKIRPKNASTIEERKN